MTIAGHTFIETTFGRACEGCGVRYVDIAGVKKEHIGHVGFCHQGALNQREFDEIQDENDRIWALIVGSATGGQSVPETVEPVSEPIFDDAHMYVGPY